MSATLSLNLRLLALLAALVGGFALAPGAQILGGETAKSIALQLPELGFLSLAMTAALISGGIDLSIIAIANLASLTAATLIVTFGLAGFAAYLALAAGLVVATLAGAINGALVAYTGLSPILATLSTMTLYGGLALGLSRGGVIAGFPAEVLWLGNGSLWGAPAPLLLFALAALVVALILNASPLGVAARMIGSNRAAVAYSGVDTQRVLLKVYLLSGLLSGLAGVVMLARFNSARAGTGESYLLQTLLAAVLGGVDPNGGRGDVSSLILGLLILQVISSGLNLLEVSSFLTLAAWGVVLLAVTARSDWVGTLFRRRETLR